MADARGRVTRPGGRDAGIGSAGGLFRVQARADFHHIGAVAPSGRGLANALADFMPAAAGGPRRVLEIGAGTGAVTEALAARLGREDTLLVVERNAAFAAHLRQRLVSESMFRGLGDRIRLLHADVRTLCHDDRFHFVVSSLPFNNFTADEVAGHLRHFLGMLEPEGCLAFFEYLWIRRIRGALAGRMERERLRGVGGAIAAARRATRASSVVVWRNLPPALVHGLRIARDAERRGV